MATAGAIWFNWQQLRVQDQTREDQYQSGLVRDSLFREELQLIREQLEEMRKGGENQRLALDLRYQEAVFEKKRALSEGKPILNAISPSFERATGNTTVSFIIKNVGKAPAQNIRVRMESVIVAGGIDRRNKEHTIPRIVGADGYQDNLTLTGVLGFHEIALRVELFWFWSDFGRSDSTKYFFMFATDSTATKGAGQIMTDEQARDYWKKLELKSP